MSLRSAQSRFVQDTWGFGFPPPVAARWKDIAGAVENLHRGRDEVWGVPVDHEDVQRAARVLGVGGLLLILRLPWLGFVGWVTGSVLVSVGAVLMRRALAPTGAWPALDVAVIAAFVAPALELLARADLAAWSGVAGLVRVGGALLVSRAAALCLHEAGHRRAARRWSTTFASQLAVWVPLAVHVAAAAARNEPVSVDGVAAVGVFALAVAPLGLLYWSAAVSDDEAPLPTAVAG